MKTNKLKLILHFCIAIFALYIIYIRFVRYLLADDESIAIVMLNPNQLPTTQPVLFSVVMLVLSLFVFLLLRIKPSANIVFRFMKGCYGYSLVFLLLQLGIVLGKDYIPESWNQVVVESNNLFVEVQANNTRLRAKPSLKSKILTTVDNGTIMLLNDVKEVNGATWNRILLAPNQYAWVIRVTKMENGQKKRLSKTNKFYFLQIEQSSFIAAIFGFIWGFLSYRKN